ncbi:MAG TPA: hypothetical protein VMP67_03440 [Candidatus Limnocylindria bacterium]|nr:hypothetical protein [Candidatus Limnocylindria bacterium]
MNERDSAGGSSKAGESAEQRPGRAEPLAEAADQQAKASHDEPASGKPREAPERLAAGLVSVATTIADAAGPVISAARRPVDQLASGARRMLDERSGARVRQVRRMGHQPLRNLWEVHPEARRASIRELGLQTVPIEGVAGTAVEGSAQRGGDFLPLRDRRSADWRSRWQRILKAVEGLVHLPPIEVLKFGDKYWVLDGHNRMAAALYSGQVAIDAVVYELRMPGIRAHAGPTSIAPYLEGSRDLRDVGSGRLSRTSSRPEVLRGPARPPGRPADEPVDDGDRE